MFYLRKVLQTSVAWRVTYVYVYMCVEKRALGGIWTHDLYLTKVYKKVGRVSKSHPRLERFSEISRTYQWKKYSTNKVDVCEEV